MAGPSTCPKCSHPLTENAKFCGKCGNVVEDGSMKTLMEFVAPPESRTRLEATALEPTQPDVPALAQAPSGPETTPRAVPPGGALDPKIKKTMVQFSPVEPPAAPAAPAARVPAAKTMIGVAATDFRIPPATTSAPASQPAAAPPPQWTPSPAAPPQQHAPPAEPALGRPGVGKTMLGVAMPGIAPTAPGPAAAQPVRSGTMLGVAMPGIAPLRAGGAQATQAQAAPARVARPAPPLEPIVPMPPPFVDDEALPAAPSRAQRSGVPMAAVAGILAGVLLIAGITIALLWKGAPPIVAHPALDAQGRETLRLACEGCADGTQVVLGGNKTEFKGHEANLPLSSPLTIGDNPFALQINRPGIGRDETIKIVVPVTFRIRADMANVSAKPPVITVQVEATQGTDVEVDGKRVALDNLGHGSYSVDISAETEGQSATAKRVEKKIPYVVAHKGAEPSKGTLAAGVAVVPLQLDAPTSHEVTDQTSVVVAGQTTPGATVTVNGDAAKVNGAGAFATTIPAPTAGDVPVEIIAAAPQQAARAVHIAVKRVDNLEAEAKAAEATTLLSYDAVRDDIAGHVGQRILVEGEIIESRLAGHQTIIVLTDRRGCAKKADPNECLARVLFGGEDRRKRGESVRVFGRITRAVGAQNGRSVPEIEADFLARPRGG